jgi:hypothetical protein
MERFKLNLDNTSQDPRINELKLCYNNLISVSDMILHQIRATCKHENIQIEPIRDICKICGMIIPHDPNSCNHCGSYTLKFECDIGIDGQLYKCTNCGAESLR